MDYFKLCKNGIRWTVRKGQVHTDDIEMAGFQTADLVTYGVAEGGVAVFGRYCVFPSLRTIPNNTHASLRKRYEDESFPVLLADGKEEAEKAVSFTLDGILTAKTRTSVYEIRREFFPAEHWKAAVERTTVKNISDKPVRLSLSTPEVVLDAEVRGTKGMYQLEVVHDHVDRVLAPNESFAFDLACTGRIANEPIVKVDGKKELSRRRRRCRELMNAVTLTSDDKELDTMFRFACLRAGESIFRTITGDIHAPGGTKYYAASWCNDQVEYVGPWFAQTGDKVDLNASMNAYGHYIPFMSDSYHHIPSSVISEGLDIWEGKGDRGDAAMYLFGGAFFALVCNNEEYTEKLWNALKWCAEYCHRKTGPEGVVCSDTDELERRIPTDGYANLSTSCLAYGGYLLIANLADQKGEPELAAWYRKWASDLKDAIESYYGRNLHGFETYRYSNGFDTLRSWICLPLCMRIFDRIEGTLNAMFSPYLWTKNGMLSCERGEENKTDIVWDRSTLFGFKGAFLGDRVDPVWDSLKQYIHTRLLGERVPYAVEAYPENDMRHLSGESALFCRIIPEGLFKMWPLGSGKYSITPTLPGQLTHLKFDGWRLGGHRICLDMERGKPCKVYKDGVLLAQCEIGKEFVLDVR
ncbi:MAG: hypothetical protein J6B54_01650 [Clostridia bacterium]|nr:hypothetical protein [Clostridia bacterium]